MVSDFNTNATDTSPAGPRPVTPVILRFGTLSTIAGAVEGTCSGQQIFRIELDENQMKIVRRKIPMRYLTKQRQSLMALAIVLASTFNSAAQSSGTLDTTFGTNGTVTTDFGAPAGLASVAVQPDGKIVAAGTVSSPVSLTDFALSRYNTDGTLDASFGAGGKVTTDF